jgi:hypothetical protein
MSGPIDLIICPVDLAAGFRGLQTPDEVSPAALERVMKLQDVILKAIAKKISSAEIAGDLVKEIWEEAGALL